MAEGEDSFEPMKPEGGKQWAPSGDKPSTLREKLNLTRQFLRDRGDDGRGEPPIR